MKKKKKKTYQACTYRNTGDQKDIKNHKIENISNDAIKTIT